MGSLRDRGSDAHPGGPWAKADGSATAAGGPWARDLSGTGGSEPAAKRGEDGAGEALALTWRHPTGLWSLAIVNAMLRLATLGIYDFWARTEVRRRLWGAIRLNGEPLSYHGTGGELFRGFLLVFAIVVLPLLIGTFGLVLLLGGGPGGQAITQIVLAVIGLFLWSVAYFRAQRYRLSRTTWRGIRFGMGGNALEYGVAASATAALIPLTLGWVIPWRTTMLQARVTNAAGFGSEPFALSARAGPLYGAFAAMWFAVIAVYFVASFFLTGVLVGLAATLGPAKRGDLSDAPNLTSLLALLLPLALILVIYLVYAVVTAWFRAKTFNYFARTTTLGGASFAAGVSGRGLVWIAVTNYLIKLGSAAAGVVLGGAIALFALTFVLPTDQWSEMTQLKPYLNPIAIFVGLFGLLFFQMPSPVTEARALGYMIANTQITGALDLDGIAQRAGEANVAGEGLASAFDIDGL